MPRTLKEINDTMAKWQRNYDLAKERGDMGRARKYQGYMTELKLEKEKIETSIPKDAFEEQEKIIRSLNQEIDNFNEMVSERDKKISELEKRIENISHPPKMPEEPHAGEVLCPSCQHYIKEADMSQHSQECIKSNI